MGWVIEIYHYFQSSLYSLHNECIWMDKNLLVKTYTGKMFSIVKPTKSPNGPQSCLVAGHWRPHASELSWDEIHWSVLFNFTCSRGISEIKMKVLRIHLILFMFIPGGTERQVATWRKCNPYLCFLIIINIPWCWAGVYISERTLGSMS